MTGEDLEVWGAVRRDEDADNGGQEPARATERRWRKIPVRWLVLVVVAVLLGTWINSYARLRQERDRAVDELAAARGEAGRSSQLLDLQRLESEFRTFDLLMLPEVDGVRASLGVVNVINAEGDPRTWLLLRARGAVPGSRYRLDISACPGSDADFPPFSAGNEAAPDGDLEVTAQNLDVPTDLGEVTVVLRGPGGDPLVGIRGPLVLPRRTVTEAAAANLC